MSVTPTENHPEQHLHPAAHTVRAALRSPRLLRTEVLAGLVVALALIPEAISFSIIAGVDPQVGLFASFTMAVAISFLGGRPAMISAATGAIALVVAPVMRDYGYDYLIATVLLGGLMQLVLALVGVARLMRFVPRSVMRFKHVLLDTHELVRANGIWMESFSPEMWAIRVAFPEKYEEITDAVPRLKFEGGEANYICPRMALNNREARLLDYV